MSGRLVFASDRARDDLVALLGRAANFGDGGVRLTAHGALVMVTVPVTASAGLLDLGPTILGVRVQRLAAPAAFDAVVPIDAVLRAKDAEEFDVPEAGTMPAWASLSAPQAGWEPTGSLSAAFVTETAKNAAIELAAALPESPGEAVVRRARRAVWSRKIGSGVLSVGAAVAAHALGFLGDDDVRVSTIQGWTRASTRLGEILER